MKWFTTTRLSPHQELTPEGFLLCRDIAIARCGVQHYHRNEVPSLQADGNGWVAVEREPAEVFREDSISSFHGKPITDDHPYEMVTPDNYSTLAIGHIQNIRRGENSHHDCLVADLLFTTARGVNLVRGGKRALSVGYDAAYESLGPGKAKQKNIVANHVALVDEGRCGPRCTILDGMPHYAIDAEWNEREHPRGQPENKGQFAEVAAAGREAAAAQRERVREGKGAAFVSPSLAEHLDFPHAVTGLQSNRQRILERAAREIDKALGLKSHHMPAVGAWSDGAENSIMSEIDGGTFEQLHVAAAMKAHIAEQKAALVFQDAEGSKAVLYSFPAKGDLDAIHRNLLEDGVEFHTVIPTKNGATVYVVDTEGDQHAAQSVAKAAKRYGSKVVFDRGHADFIGTTKQDGTDAEQRSDALAAYERIIAGSGVRGADAIWQRIHHAYGATLHGVGDAWNEAEHPRGQPENAGQFAEVPGGGSGPKAVGAAKPKWTTSQKKNAEIAAGVLRAAGFKAMTENPSGRKTDARFAAIGSATNGILVNPRSRFWKDPEASAKLNREGEHLSTSSPLGVLLHEIGHLEHPDVRSNWMAEREKQIAQKVSKYAGTNPKEFVAETFAGLHSGQEYDDEVMGLFKALTWRASAPKLPPEGRTGEARERYAEIQELADRVRRATASLPAALKHIPMYELQNALNDLWSTRMQEGGKRSGKLSKADQEINDTLRGEVSRRYLENQDAREKRALEYAWMSDAELNDEVKKAPMVPADLEFFGGDSRMKPGMKRQIGQLPPSHISKLARNGITLRAVQEIEAMPADHTYAPGMHPAGLFETRAGRVRVADQITLPDGSVRLLAQRAATMRHEIGHAIDDITGLSYNPVLLEAINDGINRMTTDEREAAAYWVGDTVSGDNQFARNRVRASEMFAELYSYAYDEGTEFNTWAFGGLSQQRLVELFGKARRIMREKIAEEIGDRTLDQFLREAA